MCLMDFVFLAAAGQALSLPQPCTVTAPLRIISYWICNKIPMFFPKKLSVSLHKSHWAWQLLSSFSECLRCHSRRGHQSSPALLATSTPLWSVQSFLFPPLHTPDKSVNIICWLCICKYRPFQPKTEKCSKIFLSLIPYILDTYLKLVGDFIAPTTFSDTHTMH